MKKFTFLLCILALVLMLGACDAISPGENSTQETTEADTTPIAADPFAMADYYVMYQSNGDGTCTVSGVVVRSSGVRVEIPESSPAGDTVTAVKLSLCAISFPENMPLVMTEQRYNEIRDAMKANGMPNFDMNKLLAHYMPVKPTSSEDRLERYPLGETQVMYVLTDSVSESEYDRISSLYEKYLAGQSIASVEDCNAVVLSACAEQLTPEQTEQMLLALYTLKPSTIVVPASLADADIVIENGDGVTIEKAE